MNLLSLASLRPERRTAERGLRSRRNHAGLEEIQKPGNQESIHGFLASEFFPCRGFGLGAVAPANPGRETLLVVQPPFQQT